MLCGEFQISGYKNIFIKKLVAGSRLRFEAIVFHSGRTYAPRLIIGDNVSFGTDVHVGCIEGISLGNNVLCGSYVTIIDHDHGVYAEGHEVQSAPTDTPSNRPLHSRPIVIGDNVHIGDHVVILKGAVIGNGSIIGAGSVVTGVIPEGTIAAGNPAKIIKRFDANLSKWVGLRDTKK